MKTFSRCISFVAIVVSTALGLIACSDDTVTLHYDESATCYLFDSDPTGSPHTTTSSSNGLFVIYKINSIDNTKSGAKDFNFTPAKVYSGSQNFANNQSFDYLLQLAQPKTVPKGSVANNVGKIIINSSADPKKDQQANFPLYYNSSSGESVLLVRDNINTPPPFLDPCSPTAINGL